MNFDINWLVSIILLVNVLPYSESLECEYINGTVTSMHYNCSKDVIKTDCNITRNGITFLKTSGCDNQTLGEFRNLTELDISSNQIKILPLINGSLTELRKVHASHNQITNISVSFFANALNLTEIDLSSNSITSLDLPNFHNLTTLDVSLNPIKQINDGTFSKFAALQKLNLSHTNLTEFKCSVFNQHTNMKVLDVSGNDFELECTETNDVLEELYMDVNQTTETCRIYQHFSKLQKLFISNMQYSPNDLEEQCESSINNATAPNDSGSTVDTHSDSHSHSNDSDNFHPWKFIFIMFLVFYMIGTIVVIVKFRRSKILRLRRDRRDLRVAYRHDARGAVISLVGFPDHQDDDKKRLIESN